MPYLLAIVMVLLAKNHRTSGRSSGVWPEGSFVTWIVTQPPPDGTELHLIAGFETRRQKRPNCLC